MWRGKLQSLYTPHTWKPGPQPEAWCRRTYRHHAPEPGCECGWAGLYDLTRTERLHAHDATGHSRCVIGAALAWGRIERGEVGSRSEFMQMLALASSGDATRLWALELVGRAYRVPLIEPAGLTLYASEFGEIVHG